MAPARTDHLLARLDTEIERFYLTRARAVIDARLARGRHSCGLADLRAAIDRMKTGGLVPMASAPKPTMSALAALPGLVAKTTAEANADAEKEVLEFAKVAERKDAAFTRIREHRTKMTASIGEMEKFAEDIDAAIGGNGAPPDLPTSEGSDKPSETPPETGNTEAGDTRASSFSALHPSQRRQNF